MQLLYLFYKTKNMNCFRFFSALSLCILLAFTSCTKTETITKIEVKTDTLQIAAKDTTFLMTTANWDFFDYVGLTILPASPTTYVSTPEGILAYGQQNRYGARLQVKKEVGFKDKTIYYKWKFNNGGQFAAVAVSVKYVPISNDGFPAIQGIDFGIFSTPTSTNGSIVVQPNTWYYSRLAAVKGTDMY